MSEITNYLRATATNDVAKLNQILQQLQKMITAVTGDLKKELVVFSPETKTRTTTGSAGEPPVKKPHTTTHDNFDILIKPVASAKSWNKTVTTTGTLTFTATDSKRSGNAKFDGSSYITINDHTDLNPNAISISVYVKLPTVSSDALIVKKDGQYELKATSSGIEWRVNTGSWSSAITTTYTANTWTLITACYTDGTLTLYKDGSSVATASVSGNIATTSNNLSIGGNGSNNLPNNSYLSHLLILDSDVGSTWVSDWNTKAVLDINSKNPIIYYEFIKNEPSFPATNGLVVSA